jgi:hypothetical protein
MKTGLSTLGRPCSIGAFAQTASTPCPFTTQSGSRSDKVGSKTKGDQFIAPGGQPSTARGVNLEVVAMVYATIVNASVAPILRDVHFVPLNGGGGA